jgi:chromosomal replication initiator protein
MNYFIFPGLSNQDISIDLICKSVCFHYNLSEQEIKADIRHRAIVEPRQIAMYFAVYYTRLTISKIGNYFGRDHATVLYSRRSIDNLKNTDKEFAKKIDCINNLINSRIQFE